LLQINFLRAGLNDGSRSGEISASNIEKKRREKRTFAPFSTRFQEIEFLDKIKDSTSFNHAV